METPKKKFDFVVHRNGFNENVVVFDKGARYGADANTLSGG